MKKLIFAGLFLCSSMAAAAPSVFVRSEKGQAWWTREMEARILGQSASMVTSSKLSDYLSETMEYYAYRVCSLEPIQADTFVGLDRTTQSEITDTTKLVKWRAESVTTDGRSVVGQARL